MGSTSNKRPGKKEREAYRSSGGQMNDVKPAETKPRNQPHDQTTNQTDKLDT